MHAYVYDQHENLVRWAEERIPFQQFRDDARAIGHARDGVIVAVAVFDTFARNDCLVGLASDGSRRWMTREFATRVFAYPFIQCGFNRISCLISEQNADSLAYTRKMGWMQEGRQRRAGIHGEDLLLFGMLRDECRWIPPAALAMAAIQ